MCFFALYNHVGMFVDATYAIDFILCVFEKSPY